MYNPRLFPKWIVPGLFVLTVLLVSIGRPTRAVVADPVPDPAAQSEVVISLADQERVKQMILAYQTEAMGHMNVPEYHAQNIKGSGVSIAVLDVGYAGLDTRIAEGEIPGDVERLTYDGSSITSGVSDSNEDPNSPCYKPQPHGTAVAEVIHDIAPEAKLYLVQITDTDATNMKTLMNYLHDKEVRIVSVSLGFGIWRGNGSGPGYNLFEDLRQNYNMLFIESAGNSAQTNYASNFIDKDNDGRHEFTDYPFIPDDEASTFSLGQCGEIRATLTWDDWDSGGGQGSNYDLVVLNLFDQELARSKLDDGYPTSPRETVSYTYTGSSPIFTGKLRVERIDDNVDNRKFRFQAWGTQPIQFQTQANSLSSYGDSEYVFAVAAARAKDKGLENYSARGPTSDGRIKPDITGYARVSTAAYAHLSDGFSGTSSAAPHVAGAAALLLQINPSLSADELAQLLTNSAMDVGSAEKDNKWGAGLVRLPAIQSGVTILAPTTEASDYVGDPSAPSKTLLEVSVTTSTGTQWAGLGASDFEVTVGGQSAIVTTVRKLADRYLLEIIPPDQLGAGAFDLVVAVDGQSASQTGALRYAALGDNRADVMIILDRSGSMGGQPIIDARNSAVLFTELMNQNDAIGVSSYSSSSTLNYPLTPITDDSIKTAAKNAILAIGASGNTSIGAGLVTGRDQLLNNGDDNHAWVIVLLSDGRENRSPYISSVLPTIASTKIKVFSIGLGSVDESKMSLIATETGGSYYFTPDSADLASIYNSISGQVSGRQSLFTASGAVEAGQTVSHYADVDPAVNEAIFSVSWNTSSSKLDLVLFQPDGLRIDSVVAETDPEIDLVSGATYQYYVVRNPQPGEWRLDVTGVNTSVVSRAINAIEEAVFGEAYSLSVQGVTELTLELSADQAQYAAGDPIQLLLSLSETGPLPDANAIATITRPDGLLDALPLVDDGNHGDNIAGDGVYGAFYYRTNLTGTYHFNVKATGSSAGLPFTRVAELAVVVSAATDADKDGMPDAWEIWNNLDPLRNDASEDPDLDSLISLDEYRYGVDPWDSDTDTDRLLDGEEVNIHGTNPRVADTDMGGVGDGEEVERGTDPLDPTDDVVMPSIKLYLPSISSYRHSGEIQPTSTPRPTSTPTATIMASPTSTASATSTPTATRTQSPTPTTTATSRPSSTPTLTPTVTWTPSPTATPSPTQAPDAPRIDVWYGDNQTFGALGHTQQWINILGAVSGTSPITSLTYSVSGGPDLPLNIGPDQRRLYDDGAFNVQLNRDWLPAGANEVVLKASNGSGTTIRTVTVNHVVGNTWPLPYTIDWSSAGGILDVAQPVDGWWEIENGELYTVTPGFDRLMAIGDDMAWTDYEVTVPVTVYSLNDSEWQAPSNGAGVGLFVRWDGHYEIGSEFEPPFLGWRDFGALAWYRWDPSGATAFELRGDSGVRLVSKDDQTIDLNKTYLFKLRIESSNLDGVPSTYRFKFWEEGAPEPELWYMESEGEVGEPSSGSMMLAAHQVEASFGDVIITKVENDASSQWQPTGSSAASGGGISNTATESSRPHLAAAPDGTVYIAWSEEVNRNGEIYILKWDGANWSEVGAGSAKAGGISNSTGDSVAPRLAVSSDGTLYAVWSEKGQADAEVYLKRWNGSSWAQLGGSASGGGISNTSNNSEWPDIAIAEDGTPYVAWQETMLPDSEIYVRYWNGTSWEEFGANSASGGGISNNSSDSGNPSIALEGDGPSVAWTDAADGADYEVYLRRWSGSTWAEIGGNSATGGGISNNSGTSRGPALAIDNFDNYYLAWPDDSNGTAYNIYVKYLSWGASQWVELDGSAHGGGISQSATNSIAPEIAIDASRVPYVTWYNPDPGEVYVRRRTNGSWEEVGTGSATGGGLSQNSGKSNHSAITISMDATPFVAWADDTSGNFEIYVKHWAK